MLSSSVVSSSQNRSLHFGSSIRLEKPEDFQRGLAASQTLAASQQTDPLRLGDSPYQSPGWQVYEQLCNANKSSSQPIACYPWGINSIERATDIYTGAIITGAGGGITDGNTAVRFHFDRQPENLAELDKASENSALKKPLLDQMSQLDAQKRSALILGGNTSLEAFQSDSRTLFHRLLGFFGQHKIKTSYLWGQDSTRDTMAQTRAYYTTQDDTWHILKLFKDPSTQAVSGPPQSIWELSQAFQDIHLCRRDKLFLGSSEEGVKAISPLRLNLTVFFYHLPQRFAALKTKLLHRLNQNAPT